MSSVKLNSYQPWLALGLFIVLVLGQLITMQPYAQDDLLRNVVSFRWSYAYDQLYAFTPGLPPFNPYIGFDWLWGSVAQTFSPSAAVHAAQITGSTLLLGLMLKAIPSANRTPEVYLFVTAGLLGTLLTSRLVAGRPEIWATIWLLSAAVLKPKTWVAVGVLLSPAYWLMPMYALGAFLLEGLSFKKAVLWCAIGGAGASAFWLGTVGLDWVTHAKDLLTLTDRPIPAKEAAPVVELLKHPGTWLLAGWGLWLTKGRFNWKQGLGLAVPFLFFCVTGGVRHILVLAPLYVLWVVRSPVVPSRWRAHFLLIMALAAGLLSSMQMPTNAPIGLDIPGDARVLTGFNKSVFYLPHEATKPFQLAPSIESGWDAPEVVALAKAVGSGSIACGQLVGHSFTHVVTRDHSLTEGCFTEVQKQGPWILWEVAPSARKDSP